MLLPVPLIRFVLIVALVQLELLQLDVPHRHTRLRGLARADDPGSQDPFVVQGCKDP